MKEFNFTGLLILLSTVLKQNKISEENLITLNAIIILSCFPLSSSAENPHCTH